MNFYNCGAANFLIQGNLNLADTRVPDIVQDYNLEISDTVLKQ